MDIRSANPNDAPLIAAHRRAMFAEMQAASEPTLALIEHNSTPWTERMIHEGKYLGWIASDNGKPVGSAGLLILDWPPHPRDPHGTQRAYLLNVYVEPSSRGQGLARQLVQLSMDEAHRRNILVITLHASDAGRPLYEKLDFHTTNEMMYVTPPQT